jgi:hypothetical protein
MATIEVNSKMTFKEIEAAINGAEKGDTINFSPGTYYSNVPEDRIHVKVSGVTLNGAGKKTVFYGKPEGAWFKDKQTRWSYLHLDGVSNVTISNIWFNSDCTSNPGDRGLYESRRCIIIQGGSNNTVHHCGTLGFTYLDFVSVFRSTNICMYECTVCKHGHTAFYAVHCNGGRVYNNTIGLYTNACLRVDGSTNIEFDHNNLIKGAGGQASWEFQNNCDGVNIHHNIISNINYPLTQSLGAKGKVSFHDNVYWNCKGLQIGSGDGNKDIKDSSEQDIDLWVSREYGRPKESDIQIPEPAQVNTHVIKLLQTTPCILIQCESSETQQKLFDALKATGLIENGKMEITQV